MLLTENELRDYIKILVESNETGIHKAISDEELKRFKPIGKFTKLLKKLGMASSALIITTNMLSSAINLDKNPGKINPQEIVALTPLVKPANKILNMPEFENEINNLVIKDQKIDIENIKTEIKKEENAPLYQYEISGKKKQGVDYNLNPYKDGNGYSIGYGTKFLDNVNSIPKNWKQILSDRYGLNLENDNEDITLDDAKELVDIDLADRIESLNGESDGYLEFKSLNSNLQTVLIDMTYNLGKYFLRKGKDPYKDFDKHIKNYINSKKNNNIEEMKKHADLIVIELEQESPKYKSQNPKRHGKNVSRLYQFKKEIKNLNEAKNLKSVYNHLFS